MAQKVKVRFLQGTKAAYDASSKDPNTFYYTVDDQNFYLGTIKLSEGAADLEELWNQINLLKARVTILQDYMFEDF